MSTFVNGTAVLHGIEVELFSELEVRRVDDSFDHEFGTEHCYLDEVEEVGPVTLDTSLDDVRELAICELMYKGRSHRRRLFRKWMRRIVRAVDRLDPYSFWTDKQLDAAIEGWEPPEPDYE